MHCRVSSLAHSISTPAPSKFTLYISAEEIAKYRPGGYHPVRLGDYFKDGQYKVINKLGYGGFATVWLARDVRAHRNVSLKVVVAEKSGALQNELRTLKHLKESANSSHPGHKHVYHLLDFFYHDGPNGRHLCIVFDVLGPSVLLAVDYLHSSGIAHGNIHTGNILFCVPGLDTLSPEDFEQPSVVQQDGQPSGEGVPDYLVERMEFSSTNDFSEVQLIDFGGSFFLDHPPKSIKTPESLHPPELVFKLGLTKAVDIWNLGCTTYELIMGQPPFYTFSTDCKLIPQFQKVIGDLPKDWISNALRDGVLNEVPTDTQEDRLPLENDLIHYYFAEYIANPLLSKDDISTLAKCLRKMLVLDPTNRAESSLLLQDPWFTKSAKREALPV